MKFFKIKSKKVALFMVGKEIIAIFTFGVADSVNKDVVDSEVLAEDLFN